MSPQLEPKARHELVKSATRRVNAGALPAMDGPLRTFTLAGKTVNVSFTLPAQNRRHDLTVSLQVSQRVSLVDVGTTVAAGDLHKFLALDPMLP